jgi:ABC-type transporter MlaC component
MFAPRLLAFQKQSMTLRAVSIFAFVVPLAAVASAQELPARGLEQLVAEVMRSNEPDRRDLHHVSMRGAALFMALAAGLPTETDDERTLASGLQRQALPFYQVAIATGLLLKQDVDTTQQQMQRFMEAYAGLIQRARERGDTMLAPSVRKDLEALLPIVPVITVIAEEYEKAADNQGRSPAN